MSHELPNDLRLGILGNEQTLRKSQKCNNARKLKTKSALNALITNVLHHIETSVNQLTGFYMMGNIGR